MLSRALLLVVAVICIATIASAVDSSDYDQAASSSANSLFSNPDQEDSLLEETGRFFYVTATNTGIILTFNKTSTLIPLLFSLGTLPLLIALGAAIAAAIAIPIAVGVGIYKKYAGGDEDYGYYTGSGSSDSGYGGGDGHQSAGSSYTDYAKR